MLWLLAVVAALGGAARWRWFRSAISIILPVCQCWSLLAEDMNRNGAADAMEEIILVATNATSSVVDTMTLKDTLGTLSFFVFVIVTAAVSLMLSLRIVL